MSALEESHLPQIRTNKHFRIKSASKEKILMAGELLTTRHKRKNSTDDQKRVLSDHKNRNSASIDHPLKITITKDILARNFQKRPSNKQLLYQAVKTDAEAEEPRPAPHLRTLTHEPVAGQLAELVVQQRTHGALDELGRGEEGRAKKERTAEKEPKAKYRCRVNQYIFDHSRKKSHCSKEQEAID